MGLSITSWRDAFERVDPEVADEIAHQYHTAHRAVRAAPGELHSVAAHLVAAIGLLEKFQRDMRWASENARNDCEMYRAGHYSAAADLGRHVKQALQQLTEDVEAASLAYRDAQED